MLKNSSSKSSGKSGSNKVSGVHLSGSYGGASSSSSRPSSPSKPSGSKNTGSGSWTSGSLNSASAGSSRPSLSTGGSGGGSVGGVKLSIGGGSTPIPSGAKKVTLGSGSAGRITAPSSSSAASKVLGAYTGGGAAIPRYDLPGFHAISTPESTGKIKGWNGGKLVNGVIKYPTTANVDAGKAARAQAFVDYSYGNSTGGNSAMGGIYGKAYYDELERLANLPVGAPAWGTSSTGKGPADQPGFSGGGGGGSFERNYEDAIRAAQEAAADALRQQVEQGVSDIYAQKGPLEEQFQKAAQQLYIANMQGKKALPEQLATQGLTGGATESANLALETTFGEGLGGLLEYYNQAIAQLDRDAANLRASGNIQQAQNVAEFAKQLAQYAYETQQRMLDLQAKKELASYQSGLDYDRRARQ